MNGVDHLVYAVPDLDEAVEWLERTTGIRAVAGGRHIGMGSRNALAGVGGDAYLELIGPDPEQDVDLSSHPFGLAELTEPRLATWAVRVDDIDRAVGRARDHGYDPGEILPLERQRPDGVILRWRLTRLPQLPFGGVVPFLIDWGDSPRPSADAPEGLRLVSLTVRHPAADLVRTALAALDVEPEVEEGAPPQLVAAIDSPKGRLELR